MPAVVTFVTEDMVRAYVMGELDNDDAATVRDLLKQDCRARSIADEASKSKKDSVQSNVFSTTVGRTMKDSIVKCLKRKRSVKDWSAIAVLAIAIVVELVDAGFGINGIASTSDLAASNVVDIADLMIGGAAAWLLHG